ncbi:MAG TPA: YHS domain-containing protein [Ignavibacteriaceae bacterium]|nr:YHS domain-containing protein [Ignavibacteriaceae bacterium]
MTKLGILLILFFIVLGYSVNSFAQSDQKKDEKTGIRARTPEKEVQQEGTATADSKPFNSICAVSGEDVDKSITYTYEGKTYAFCCNKCLSKFKKDPAKYASRISEDGKSLKKSKG